MVMPRAARREREKDLVHTAKKCEADYAHSAPTKQPVESEDIDSGTSNSTLMTTAETSPNRLSHHSDSESNFSDPSLTSASEILGTLRYTTRQLDDAAS